MKLTSRHKLLLICLGALIFRLLLLPLVHFPGIADPNYYYNLGVRLIDGHGFTLDYIWQYKLPPAGLVHPVDHWMPLTAVLAGVPMAWFGQSVDVSLSLFILIGSLLPMLSFWGARQLELSDNSALFAAALTALLPELAVYSLRTDTVIPMALLVGLSILLLTRGLRTGRARDFIASGVMAGLSYLTRNDGALLLPMMLVTLIVYALWRQHTPSFRPRAAWLMPLVAVLVVVPWIIRDLNAFGLPATPESTDMFFFTSHNDHYAFGRHFTLQTMLAAQTPAQIISKRAFELAAAIKVMIQSLDVVLPLAVIGGLLLLILARDRRRLLVVSPTLILLFGLLVAYPILIPYKSQAGSFKKAYVSLLPLLIPLGALAFQRALTDRRIRRGAAAITLALLAANAFDAVRLDQQTNDSYLDYMGKMLAVERTLPDTNGDGEVILMAQDPYILRYLGIRSIMFPNESRDMVIQIAHRYGVDYLLMPPNRPALDPLMMGAVSDPRFVPLKAVPDTNLVFYALKDGPGD